MFNLILTSKQSGLIQCHIYDYCNWMLTKSKFSEYDTSTWDEYDIIRASIYYKERRLSKNRSIIKGLSEKELKFISSEIQHWVVYKTTDPWGEDDNDRQDKRIAKNLVNKINQIFDKSIQRNLKLSQIGI